MATFLSTTIDGSMGSDAEFQTINTFIEGIFSGGGWTNTADTGQMTVASATRPGVNNTAAGYRIWRMSDSLQGSAPIYLKVEYGIGAGSTIHSTWITIGKGTDGAGTVTDVIGARRQYTQAAANVNTSNTYGAAGSSGSWITFAFCSTITQGYWFSIERTKDSTGADTGDGIILAGGQSAAGHFSHYLPYTGSIPTVEVGCQYILSTVSPSTFGGDTGIGVMIPIKGIAQQPGLNVCFIVAADFAVGATIPFTIYGATHTYQRMDSISSLKGTNAALTSATDRLILRYE